MIFLLQAFYCVIYLWLWANNILSWSKYIYGHTGCSVLFFFYSVYVAQFPEYTDSLIAHLADVKVHHWDRLVFFFCIPESSLWQQSLQTL